jgi:hypothetical protein
MDSSAPQNAVSHTCSYQDQHSKADFSVSKDNAPFIMVPLYEQTKSEIVNEQVTKLASSFNSS